MPEVFARTLDDLDADDPLRPKVEAELAKVNCDRGHQPCNVVP